MITQHMESFCDQFYKEQLTEKKRKIDTIYPDETQGDTKAQLSKLSREIQEKEVELSALKAKQEELKKLPLISNDKAVPKSSPKKILTSPAATDSNNKPEARIVVSKL